MSIPKFLVVDDAQFMRSILGDAIRSSGYTDIYFAGDGFEAIEKAGEIQPDLITLDISMPGLDGLQAVSKILEISPNSKIIMVSAVNNQNIIKEALKSGAVDFINKPFSKDEIEDRIKRYIR